MIITDLEKKLDNEFQKYYNIVLINGTWGIGKTYYIRKYLDKKKYIYVSMFGINSIENLKYAIYYELNKMGAKLNNFLKNNFNRDIGISIVTIPIPNLSSDIEKKIKKQLKNKNLILVIDDLERKSDSISTKELLGFIESLSQIENIKIIIVANESIIKDKEDYSSFKEKVINKTYNITQYSDDAINVISWQLLEDNSIDDIVSNKDFYDVIRNILSSHKLKNLRTLKKAILFSKIFLQNFNNGILKGTDKLELIKICFAIVIEDCDSLYYEHDKDETLDKCILKKYLNDTFINNKLDIIRPIINIYKDEDIELNYKRALDYYVGKYSVSEEEKDIFYCNEDEVEKRLINFVDNNINKINSKIDINVWFKEFNTLYPWAIIINKQNLFNKDKIMLAIKKYAQKININKNLYNIIDRTMSFHISHDDMREYYKVVKKEIAMVYFSKLVDKIKQLMEMDTYDVDLIRTLLDTLTNTYLIDDSTRVEMLNIIERNAFFIPNINGDISEEQWHWCHIIWEKCSMMVDDYIKEKLYQVSQEVIINYTTIGKYRINSLNNQYGINDSRDNNNDD